MPEFRADLHCHTTCSDGTTSPEEIVRMAASIGLSGLSITDHDSINAYEIAAPVAQELGIRLLPGVEFSSIFRETSIHILGYGFSLKSLPLRTFCQRHLERRKNRNQAILERLKKEGMAVSEHELADAKPLDASHRHHTPGRPHIALAMVKKGYVKTIQEAFYKYLGEKGTCYVPGEPFSIEETIEIIHQSGGIAIIAHPHLIEKRSIKKQLLSMAFDGLEAYYAKFPPWEEKKWVQIAEEKGWLITGGSDFHGEHKPYITLGCAWVNEEIFNRLWLHYKQHE